MFSMISAIISFVAAIFIFSIGTTATFISQPSSIICLIALAICVVISAFDLKFNIDGIKAKKKLPIAIIGTSFSGLGILSSSILLFIMLVLSVLPTLVVFGA